MKKLLAVQAAISLIAGWVLVNTKVPIDKSVKVKVYELSAERILREAKIESARRDVRQVLRGYNCSDTVLELVSRNAVDFSIRPRLLAASVAIESGCRPDAVSTAGAVGLMQIEPTVWHVSKRKLYEPETNIRTGARILSASIEAHGERNAVRRFFGISPGSEQSDLYANRVFAAAR
jgi:soluble lytic murein transglycosylase-like protein